MRPSGPTESDQHVSESGCCENGYHFTGYGVDSLSWVDLALASAATAGARPAGSQPLPTFMKVRRSICPDPIDLLLIPRDVYGGHRTLSLHLTQRSCHSLIIAPLGR